jgi:molybdopterin molybdotransferase
MLTVQEAHQIVMSHLQIFGSEYVPIEQSLGRILHENICADRDLPPFDRVTMDGIAINFEKWKNGQRTFEIEATIAAGSLQQSLQNAHHCFEIMTGAMLPIGTDTIIRYEDLKIENGCATILNENIEYQQEVHFKGQDRKQGDAIVASGRQVSAAELGVAASVGKMMLKVAIKPKAVVISTGDELVQIHDTPLPHQIRSSNRYALQAALKTNGMDADSLHLPDDSDVIERELARCLAQYDVVFFSGGVSAGKFDYVPAALDQLGVKKLFHKVAQKPGKPFWFGQSLEGKAVFALPGNPVSTFMCLYRYALPWLRASLGAEEVTTTYAALAQDYHFNSNLTYFLQVRLETTASGLLLAHPVTGNGSGDLANLVDADGFLELPHNQDIFFKNELFSIVKYR